MNGLNSVICFSNLRCFIIQCTSPPSMISRAEDDTCNL